MPPRAAPRAALITGATGFIGRHLARRLLQDGWRVEAVVRPGSDPDRLPKGTAIHRHDKTTQGLIDILGAARPGVVFHLASLFRGEHAPADIEPLVQSNVLFGLQLLEAMAAHGVSLLVNAGTSWQHYHDEPYRPVNLYAATKQAFEDILLYYADAKNIRAITLKLFDTYGPEDARPKLFSSLARARTDSVAMSPGRQKIDLVYIDDVVDAFMLAARRLLAGKARKPESYAVSSGKPIELRKLVELYQKVTARPLRIKWGGRPYRDREVFFPWKKGRRLPGWRPKVGLADGIQRTLTF
ncbi:MAG: NAD(P)-dependent oxidoreductase [Elusimicrobia bacterium]|nr:NAD(P)-dependent oxidoreductase [Elusimicrobiota bacterium]